MHIDLESSLTVPKDRPLNLTLAPTAITVTASGKPRVSVGPFEVQLPDLEVELPEFDVVLPEPKVEGTLYTIIPYVEYPFAGLAVQAGYIAGGQNAANTVAENPATGLVESLASLVDGDEETDLIGPTIDPSMTRKMPAARNPDNSDALRLNGMGVGIGFEGRANLGTLRFVPKRPLRVRWTKTLAVHGVPIDEKNGPVPMYVEVDLDPKKQPVQVRAAIDEVDVRFRGAVELDGIKKR